MKPIKYTRLDNGDVRYNYTFTQLRSFLSHGFKEGNNGFILVGQSDNFYDYKGFGTIESPCKELRSISIEHDPRIDGKKLKPENVINPPKKANYTTSFRTIIWDANGENREL